jgi:hypothetical protein
VKNLLLCIVVSFLYSCSNSERKEEGVSFLDIVPAQIFQEDLNGIYLTEAKIGIDSFDVFIAISNQGLIVKTDSLLNLISFVNGRDYLPDFDFPLHLDVHQDKLIVEEMAYQRIFTLDKGNFEYINSRKFPTSSQGISFSMSPQNRLIYSSYPEAGKTGLVWLDMESGYLQTSKVFMPQEKVRLSDQLRLGCFCQQGSWSVGRFLPILEQLDPNGNVVGQVDLSIFEPLKRGFDTLMARRANDPDFEINRKIQNLVTSLDCWDNKLLIGFTDMVGSNRTNIRHLLLFSTDQEGDVFLEKILRLKTGNDDEMYHFQGVKYNPITSFLYAQGSETNYIYAFKVNL